MPQLEVLLRGGFDKRRFLDLIRQFIVFGDDAPDNKHHHHRCERSLIGSALVEGASVTGRKPLTTVPSKGSIDPLDTIWFQRADRPSQPGKADSESRKVEKTTNNHTNICDYCDYRTSQNRYGRASDIAGFVEGIHDQQGSPAGLLIDEAKSIRDEILDTLERCHTTFRLFLSSTGRPAASTGL